MASLHSVDHFSPENVDANSESRCRIDRIMVLLSVIVDSLVDSPFETRIEKHDYDGRTIYRIFPKHEEMGQLIGKKGLTGSSIRHIIKSAAQRFGYSKFVYLEIIGDDSF